jgi:hypothetical protein
MSPEIKRLRAALRARQRGFFTLPGGMGAHRPAGGGAPPTGLLDAWTTNTIFAGNLRLLIGSYYGSPAVRIRRSGDNAETDIGFTALGVWDSAAAAAFCVAGGGTQHGYVVTLYNQTGGGHATIATTARQPQIVASGVALARIAWDGTGSAWGDDQLVASLAFSSSNSFTYFVDGYFDANFGGARVIDTSDVSAARPAVFWDAAAGGVNVRSGGYFRPRDLGISVNRQYAYLFDGGGASGEAGNRAFHGATPTEAGNTGAPSGGWSTPSAVTTETLVIGNRLDAARGSSLRLRGLVGYRVARSTTDIGTICGLLA